MNRFRRWLWALVQVLKWAAISVLAVVAVTAVGLMLDILTGCSEC